MKSPVLLRRFTAIRTQATQDWAEKLLADSLRLLGQVCAKLADAVEAQRLARTGYSQQGEFLERTDPGATSKPPSK